MGKTGDRKLAKEPEDMLPVITMNTEFYATMMAILADFMGGITKKMNETSNESTTTSQESTTLIQDEIQSMSKDYRDEATTSRKELSEELRDLGQQISREITVAMTASMEHANNLNQASLQTIIDILQNRDNVQAGTNPKQSSLYAMPTNEESPEQGAPSGSRLEKGKGRLIELREPIMPLHKRMLQSPEMPHATMEEENTGTPTPGPSKWTLPRPEPPKLFIQMPPHSPPSESRGRHGRGGGRGRGRGGGGGRGGGRGGGPGNSPDPDDDDDDGNKEDEEEEEEEEADGKPIAEDPEQPQPQPLPARRAASTPGARFTSTPGARHQEKEDKPEEQPQVLDWRQFSPAHRVPRERSPTPAGTTASLDQYGKFQFQI